MWRKQTVLEPPDQGWQGRLVNFSLVRVPALVLCLPVWEGDQGLVNMRSGINVVVGACLSPIKGRW